MKLSYLIVPICAAGLAQSAGRAGRWIAGRPATGHHSRCTEFRLIASRTSAGAAGGNRRSTARLQRGSCRAAKFGSAS